MLGAGSDDRTSAEWDLDALSARRTFDVVTVREKIKSAKNETFIERRVPAHISKVSAAMG